LFLGGRVGGGDGKRNGVAGIVDLGARIVDGDGAADIPFIGDAGAVGALRGGDGGVPGSAGAERAGDQPAAAGGQPRRKARYLRNKVLWQGLVPSMPDISDFPLGINW
jgi:hypothetical protein